MQNPTSVHPKVARYAADVCEALESVQSRDVGYGTYGIARVTFNFDGDPVHDLAVVADEFGGLSVEVVQ